eukprot:scaffold66845_cov62-Phaeocystis_antarctica.AAC.1
MTTLSSPLRRVAHTPHRDAPNLAHREPHPPTHRSHTPLLRYTLYPTEAQADTKSHPDSHDATHRTNATRRSDICCPTVTRDPITPCPTEPRSMYSRQPTKPRTNPSTRRAAPLYGLSKISRDWYTDPCGESLSPIGISPTKPPCPKRQLAGA